MSSRHYNMLRTLALVLLSFITTAAMSQQMIVHLKDGKQITYSITDVDSVEIKAPSTSDQQPYGKELSGTQANAVDLGLSVQWADHNLGAADATDCGAVFTYAEAPAKAALWSAEWRLPTEAEWQELYDHCTWTWTICDGIGGRLIKAQNGNSIFIPAAGISFDDNIYIRGSIGVYWTADAEIPTTATTPNDTPVNAIGTYFDSANIYRMTYPMTNKFTVRLVKK